MPATKYNYHKHKHFEVSTNGIKYGYIAVLYNLEIIAGRA